MSALPVMSSRGAKPRWYGPDWHRRVAAFGFLLPFLGFLLVFQYLPFGLMLHDSFQSYNLLDPGKRIGVGFSNYSQLWTDPTTRASFVATFLFGAGLVALVVPLGFAFALFLNSRLPARAVVRTIVFLPVVTSTVVTSTMWLFILNPSGLIQPILSAVGLGGTNILATSPDALIALILISVWQQVGFAAILFLAGLQSVPADVIEAARMDGAGGARLIVAIIMPMVGRTTLFVVVAMTAFALQAFAPAFVMTSGGPGTSTNFIVYQIYETAFRLYNPGFASAMAVALTGLSLLIVAIQSLFLRTKWRY